MMRTCVMMYGCMMYDSAGAESMNKAVKSYSYHSIARSEMW